MNPQKSTAPENVVVKCLRFVTQGLALASRNSVDNVITTRTTDTDSGFDVEFVPKMRSFRLKYFHGETLQHVKWVHETRVEHWDPIDTAPAAKS